jgi:NAD(P)-dependent dehydrogenase (short-subunit alcohol dehydrogenase family)
MGRLRNKTTLITGGTSGIGLATARRFLGEGARVAITGSSAASIEQARAALGSAALILRSDAGDVAAQKGLVHAVGEAFGKLDAVFINAGVSEFRPLEQWDEAGVDRTLSVNLKGPLFLVQALLPILNNPASIVLNTSINARIGMPNSSVYAASKAALISLARTLSGELIGRGVRVNAVSPGPIATPLYGKLGLAKADVDAMSAALLKQIPAGRFGNPSEIADAVVFLASDESEFIVGSEFIIDGGMSNL